ncbi:MAG: bifunctional tetrahydrofolate synthase/dihydrofolate synthase [Gammaproteobacteria bacterium]|nr:bifunctional tetrahydrofolate synthase/dihydrofolate synthase [Gammaproteobacteria bacterium]
MRFNTLNDWLNWQETLHPNSIDLGLERVNTVLEALKLSKPDFFIITIAGTNGKGSCVAILESILLQAGYKVGAYTSPHLLRYNERIRVFGQEVEDRQLCDAFTRIDNARGQDSGSQNKDLVSLTYFEFGTLAAIDIFSHANLDIVILEVGLGGRLDAVNILDADIAVLSALDIDHTDWLGTDRETIALEKAGIFRKAKPVVIIEPDVPQSALDHADKLGSPVYRIGHDFGFQQETQAWSWWSKKTKRNALTYPALRGEKQLLNAAGILMVLELLAESFPVNQQNIRSGLAHVTLPGRFQVIPGSVLQILDVAHNPQASKTLSQTLKKQGCVGKTYAVVGMLRDKDIRGVLEQMTDVIDHWIVVELNVARGEKAANIEHILCEIYAINGQDDAARETIQNTFQQGHSPKIEQAQSVTDGRRVALAMANERDRIVIFGSFITVAEALRHTL